jgi:beta-lactamase superfamily II metal-dependent hydrolase
LEKPGKSSGNSQMRWILGLIFFLVIVGGIILLTKDDSGSKQPAQQQVGEINLTEGQIRAEQAGSEHNTEINESLTGKNLTVHFLDVGQADSALLEFNGKTILIDAAEQDQGKNIAEYLHARGISRLNYVVATHPHSDHIGGMETILNEFPVENFIDSGYPHTSKTYENMLTTIDGKNIPFQVAKKGEKIELDSALNIEILNPDSQYSDELNENSIVLKISYGEVSFLLMGDAGLETEERIMKAGDNLDSNILKVGHHASTSGSGESFITAVSPEVSVIEVGAGNDYGHPHAEVLERLQKVSRVFRTDLDGTITITTNGLTYSVTTEKTGTSAGTPGKTGTKETSDGNGAYSSTTSVTAERAEETKTEGLESADLSKSALYISDLNLGDEWVKISNNGDSPVSLEAWKIEDEASKHSYTFPSYTLDSESEVAVYSAKGTDSANELYMQLDYPIWNNDGDTAYLYDNNGKLISKLERYS